MTEVQVCSVCGLPRPVREFPLRKRGSPRRQSYCRPCKADYQRAWYHRNRERHAAEVGRLRIVYRERNRRVVITAKSVPCADCGERFPPYVMDFDHVRGDKNDTVARMAARPVPLLELLTEIAKCDVVCANCHRLRTHQRGWPRPGSRTRPDPHAPCETDEGRQLRLAFERCGRYIVRP